MKTPTSLHTALATITLLILYFLHIPIALAASRVVDLSVDYKTVNTSFTSRCCLCILEGKTQNRGYFKGGKCFIFPPLNSTDYAARPPNTSRDFLRDNALTETRILKGERHSAGKTVQAIAINQQIPAPTLYFKQGDHVTIRVTNHLQEGTTIHWHGLLVPWQMDGVEGVSQHAIPPGGTFSYQFALKQSGTYWYHAHAGFQEQQGMYGAFIIDPPAPPPYKYSQIISVL